jgi:CRP-like cAMP-binding protein
LRDVQPENLDRLAEQAHEVSWHEGEVVFRQGDEGQACFLLIDGEVKVISGLSDGRRVTLARLQAPVAFGELALLGAGRRNATVETTLPSHGLELDADAVREVLRTDPLAALGVAAMLAERLQRADERVLGYALGTAAGGVAATLLAWVEARQEQGAGPNDVELTGGPADVARQSGISREATIRFMDHLELEGIVTVRRGRTIVHRPDALSRYLG